MPRRASAPRAPREALAPAEVRVDRRSGARSTASRRCPRRGSRAARAGNRRAAPVVPVRDRDAGGASLPHAHEPHGVEAERRDRVPFRGRAPMRASAVLPGFAAQLVEPDPRVDLVDRRVLRPRAHDAPPQPARAGGMRIRVLPAFEQLSAARARRTSGSAARRARSSRSGGSRRGRRRCRRGSTRRTACGRASADRSGTSRRRRTPAAARSRRAGRCARAASAISLRHLEEVHHAARSRSGTRP